MGKQININNKKNPNKGSIKIKTDKENKKDTPITDWFYMTAEDVNARMIADMLKLNGIEVELWEGMNIFQIELPDKKAIDFEPVGYSFKEPSDIAFVKNHNIRTIFAVTLEDNAFELFRPVLKLLLAEWQGFLCADSEDFKPVYGLTGL